jgi:SPASM domain peptide maturase of grasp-with-spasm system
MNNSENKDSYLSDYNENFFYFFPSVQITIGAKRGLIYNTITRETFVLPKSYLEFIPQMRNKKIFELFDFVENGKDDFNDFIHFLIESNLGMLVDSLTSFPEIEEKYESPEQIENSIIDVSHPLDLTILKKIVEGLNILGCKYLQVRSYEFLSLDQLEMIVKLIGDSTIKSIEIITKYDASLEKEDILLFVKKYSLISTIYFHTSDKDQHFYDPAIKDYLGGGLVYLTKQKITSALNCGQINKKHFVPKGFPDAFLNKCYNSCLYKKISVDASGNIKNCPSMAKNYGNIENTSLEDVLNKEGFKDVWNINKDKITGCKDCEFRHICTDCRAYTENPEDIYSKPLKCGYSPYTNEWEEWSNNPLKQKAIAYYGLKETTTYKAS